MTESARDFGVIYGLQVKKGVLGYAGNRMWPVPFSAKSGFRVTH